MIIDTWDVRSMCRSGSFITVARELTRYKLDLVGVQEVRSNKGHCKIMGFFLSVEKKRKLSNGNREFLHHRILSAGTRVEFVSDRCHI